MGWRGSLLRRALATRGLVVAGLSGAAARRDFEIVRRVRREVPLLVHDTSALMLLACAKAAASLGGSMAEAGVYRGGTARLICEVKGSATLHLFDVFDTLHTNAMSSGSDAADEVRSYFGSFHALASDVRKLFAHETDVRLHPGVFPDSARSLDSERYSFVHLDLDLERGTFDALEYFYPRLLPGAFLIGDDYNMVGVRRAFERYFEGLPGRVVGLPWGQALVTKV
jgi:O-methyltransferase